MELFISFLLKSIISSAVLYGYYSLVLRDKRFHQYNRFYLLFTLVTSIIVPFLHFRLSNFNQQAFPSLISSSYHIVLGDVNPSPTSFEWINLLVPVCATVSAIMFAMLIIRIAWIYHIKKKHSIIKMQGFDLVETELKQAPFSFLNNLFWRTDIHINGKIGEKIFVHELAHIKQKHSYDKLFSQVVLCLFWMNPLYWFIQKELNVVHEFIADSKSIQRGDAQAFAAMILLPHNEGKYLTPSHSFFNSSIKRRLIMLTTSTNAQYSYVQRVCALPILLLVTTLLTVKGVNGQTDPKLNPNASLKIENVSILQKNDSTAEVTINYLDEKGRPTKLDIAAGYTKRASSEDHKDANEEQNGERSAPDATEEIVKKIIRNPPTSEIYFVDGKEYAAEDIKKLSAEKIKTINVYSQKEAVKRYGKKGKNGAIVFTTK